jgi:uncharacterized protein (DUF2235 family)
VKRIVICADGTWNLRDQEDERGKRRPSNVTKMARAVRPRDRHGIDQIVFYHDGIGTGGPLDKLTGGAFGDGMEANVRNLYRFIVYNYEPGDELFFFGFSRGAFTVRTLAGFMKWVELIEKDDDFWVPELYACYEGRSGKDSPAWEKAHKRIAGKRPCPPIRMIGVWDTVGALGAPGFIGKMASAVRGNKYAYHDVELNDSIHNAYHALAIDERRVPFKPNLWTRPDGWAGRLEQAWFPGVHTNVGGGCTPDGLANVALHWIVDKARALDLELDDAYLAHFEPHFEATQHESMSLKYRAFGIHDRPIGQHLPHGEFVHQSAIDRWHRFPEYRPPKLREYFDSTVKPPVSG